MKKYLKENGFLSDEGKKLVEMFEKGLSAALNHQDLEHVNSAEIQTLGSNLMKMVADAVSQRVQVARKWENNPFYNMSDEKFKEYLSIKYNSPFKSLTPDEYERYGPIARTEVDQIVKEIEETRNNAPPRYMPYRPSKRGLNYK